MITIQIRDTINVDMTTGVTTVGITGVTTGVKIGVNTGVATIGMIEETIEGEITTIKGINFKLNSINK